MPTAAPHCVFTVQEASQAVAPAGRYKRDAGENLGRLEDLRHHILYHAAVHVAAPADQLVPFQEGKGMAVPGGDLLHTFQDDHRDLPVRSVAIS
mmetsp:Transcript_7758/g.14447  ORF Transcript_7758/g.14447 Transcript_7758/m.14447 type:complete len:94 (+) Transcript_7758:835-1116(+)